MKKDPISFCSKMRSDELRNDKSYVHIMKYMGSKRELLPEIKESISGMTSKGDTVIDLFAGTSSVGAYIKEDYNIVSNDIQNYSQILAKALIESSSIVLPDHIDSMVESIKELYYENKKKLIQLFPSTYKKSKEFVVIERGQWTEKQKDSYQIFFNAFPSSTNQFQSNDEELSSLSKMYFSYNKSNKRDIYLQTTFLFSETYFSFEQAMDIDSIRYAIDNIVKDEVLKSIFLASLMYAYSYCSSGTGHFAMYRNFTDIHSVEDTFTYRKKDVWTYFIRKLNDLIAYHKYIPHRTYVSYSEDYVKLLDMNIMDQTSLIYADPPYSPVHYSRFYHAIESLVKYDYDIPSFKGRYRSDRHQSPFCQKTNVKKAFIVLFEKAFKYNVNVLLSYSDTGMITQEEIKQIILDCGFEFDITSIVYDHSTLGRKGHKSNQINEYLIKATL